MSRDSRSHVTPKFRSPSYEARLAFGAAYVEGMDYEGLVSMLGEIRERAVRMAEDAAENGGGTQSTDPEDYYMQAAEKTARLHRAPR